MDKNYDQAATEVAQEYRRCEACNVFLTEGYVIGGGEEYYCNDHEPPQFQALYDADPDGDTYWTQWEDKKVKQVCEECGSDRIVSKAWAKGDIDRQGWVL